LLKALANSQRLIVEIFNIYSESRVTFVAVMKVLILDSGNAKELGAIVHDGFDVESAESFEAGFDKIAEAVFDCILISARVSSEQSTRLLDWLVKENRQDATLAFVTSPDKELKLKLYAHGADDVLDWPLDADVLEAKIKAIVRRKKFNTRSRLYFANLVIDFEARKVFVWSNPINLTKKKYDILLHLVANKNTVVKKEELAGYLWSDYADKADSFDFLFAHLKNLKRKLKEAKAELVIKNSYGVGYIIEEQ
jgi:DNA-binding response OmpR family regulator